MADTLENKTVADEQDNCTPKEIKLFERFIDDFIINKNSLFSKTKFDPDEDIENCLGLLKGIETMNKPDDKKNKEDKSLETALHDVQTSDKRYVLLWHCYYIMYLMGQTAKSLFKLSIDKDSLFVEKGKGVSSTNQAYNSEAIRPFRTLLYIFRYLWKPNLSDKESVKKKIEGLLPKTNGEEEKMTTVGNLHCTQIDFDYRIRNILLYLCKPEEYVPIVSQNHKENIWKYLSFLLQKESPNYNENDLKSLEGIIKEGLKDEEKHEDFYHKTIRPFWDTPIISTKVDSNGNLPLNTLLVFKKAIVFYGPPGTSKTYSARELAKNVISTAFAEELKKNENKEDKKEKFQSFTKNEPQIFGENDEKNEELSHIHRLQLHPNYTYDDFIAGKMITVSKEQTKIETQEGYLLKLIDKINKDTTEFKDLPHIVILDEINRVDISRVFGELFTAMESDYRKDGLDLSLTNVDGKPLKLKVPEKLYFIGTMNMIDFSLEQVDFALRRRFAWVESTYKSKSLYDIIESKQKEAEKAASYTRIDNNTIVGFVDAANLVNEHIKNMVGLGPSFKIGHTFFAEIVDLYKQLNDFNKAKSLLWNISIKPMIEAYCGTMSGSTDGFIKECEKAFRPLESNK